MPSLAPVAIIVVVIITASNSFTTTGAQGGHLNRVSMPKEAELVECRFRKQGLVLINMSDMSSNGSTRTLHADVSSSSCSGNTFLYGCSFQEDYVTVWAVVLRETLEDVHTVFCNSSTAVKTEIVHTSLNITLTAHNTENAHSQQTSSKTCPPNTALQSSVSAMFLAVIGVPALLVPHILLSP
ncbi:uncharacterized protein LOC112568572 [Pomacea canaliculata]|uniref:uncharacterized protein LOC112568572 n=1 Tax=Pomacea canaliculata TaxID=400727 RepID=UPI000D731952|nr:uncharacterized protein LOC112568572 [Pomacea canaliculata]